MLRIRSLLCLTICVAWSYPAGAQTDRDSGKKLDARECPAADAAEERDEDAPGEIDEADRFLPIREGKTRYGWPWLESRFDQDGDGEILRDGLPISDDDFARLDRTWDGRLTAADFNWSAAGALSRRKETAFALFKSADGSGDGRLTREEYLALFDRLAEEQEYLDEEDLERLIFLPRVLKARREYQTRHRHGAFQRDENGDLPAKLPGPGELAPDFELGSPDGQQRVKLSSFRGNQPVVLVFGCLSCGNYRTYSELLERMYRRRQEQFAFLRVYVREAHPSDTRQPTETNSRTGFLIKQPTTLAERCDIAQRCQVDLKIETPMIVDNLDNQVGRAYGGWPDRIYLIDQEGRVAYQGGPGPFAFNPRELEQNLVLWLLDQERTADKE